MTTFASITDIPIRCGKDNLLGIENYAKALSEFILQSATPLTVGIQGEWGTGKTSLMYLLQEYLLDQGIAVSWVNTWEYSLFKESYQTTPAVLRGMLEKLKESCGDKWTLSEDLAARVKKVSSFLGNLANQAVKEKTGLDIKEASAGKGNDAGLYAEVAYVKKEINEIIQKLISDEKNPFKKIVFFLDDLDRIDPPLAVEILEALKNVFDIENCIFVLAIDYDVVIKGLEKKFGAKTDKNEREFRSFFDKIIQVPFTMPIGAYDIDKLLKQKFSELHLDIDEEYEKQFLKLVGLTVGYIPRSIKRYINTYSLLKKIKKQSQDEEDKLLDFCLFALLGLQISYPTIFRILNQKPIFTAWDEKFARKYDIADLSGVSDEDDFTDEPWEKFIFLFCQKDPYLKSRAMNVIEIFNILRDTCGEGLKKYINSALEFASITAVDDHEDSKHVQVCDTNLRSRNRELCSNIAQELNEKYSSLLKKNNCSEMKVYQARGEQSACVFTGIELEKNNTGCHFECWFDITDFNGQLIPFNKKSNNHTDQLFSTMNNKYPECEYEKDDDGYWLFYQENNDNTSYEELSEIFKKDVTQSLKNLFSLDRSTVMPSKDR